MDGTYMPLRILLDSLASDAVVVMPTVRTDELDTRHEDETG
jgi:hypothetical protein